MTNLHQILIKINNGQGSVGQLINDDSALRNIKLSLQKLDKATESLEDTGPLSVLGTMASSLF
jgi:phospholipid/cholesterol/gamma-HCH transport system substrate-binding protein